MTDILSYISDTIFNICTKQFNLKSYLSKYINVDLFLDESKNIKNLGLICLIFSVIIYFINLTN